MKSTKKMFLEFFIILYILYSPCYTSQAYDIKTTTLTWKNNDGNIDSFIYINNNINNNINNTKSNKNNTSSNVAFFESDIKISTMVLHRLATTKFSQKSRNLDSTSRHIFFHVRLPLLSYVTDFQVSSKRRTYRSRMVDRILTKKFKASSISYLVRSRTTGCDEFNFHLKVPANEQVEITLTYEYLLRRSRGRYSIESYRDLCRPNHVTGSKSFYDNDEHDVDRQRRHHGNHHYRHNRINQFRVDVVVKETSNINKLMTHPIDTSSMKVQSIIAGLSDMIPRSASVGDNSGRTPVTLRRRLPNEVHYQFLYKEKYQQYYGGGDDNDGNHISSSSSLNWFIPREIKVSYDVQRDSLGEIQTRGSHMIYLFAPSHDKFKVLDKDVLFLVDGSSEQVKNINNALKKLLETKLSARDKFNILHYVSDETDREVAGSTPVRSIRRVVIGMAGGTEKNIKTAIEMLDDLSKLQDKGRKIDSVGDSTRYDEMREGILQSLDLLNKQKESDPYDTRLSILLYLTSIETNTSYPSKLEQEKILLSIENSNRANTILIPVVLKDCKSHDFTEAEYSHLRFLDVLAKQNNGSTQVYDPSFDFETFLLEVFESTSNVVLKDLNFKVSEDKNSKTSGVNESLALRLTSFHFPHHIDGKEIIAVGHLYNSFNASQKQLKVNFTRKGVVNTRHRKTNFRMSVSGIGKTGFVSFDTIGAFRRNGHFYEDFDDDFNNDDLEQLGARLKRVNHLERIRTHLQLQQLQEMLFLRNGRNLEESKKLQIAYREIASQYNLLTHGKCLMLDKSLRRNSAICAVDEVDLFLKHGTKAMTSDEPLKAFADNDPHFVVSVDGLTEHVCFDVYGRAGKVLQLLHDRNKVSGITINSLIVEPRNSTKINHTYIGKISLINSERKCILIDTRWISVNGTRHSWNSNTTIMLPENSPTKITIISRRLVRIQHNTLMFKIIKHYVGTTPIDKFNYLGFYIDKYSDLSHRANGLIGQFSQMMGNVDRTSMKLKQSHTNESISLRGTLTFKMPYKHDNRSIVAHLNYRRDMETGARTLCWHINNEGQGLIGSIERFLVPNLCHRGPAGRSSG